VTNTIDDSSVIKETDIIFDCPHCGKSLAIDYRGAGLSIPCTDCGKYVEVPIPAGMELGDLDSTEEEQEVRILNLRRSLAAAELRIEQLQSEVEELSTRRDLLEKARSTHMLNFKTIREKAAVMQQALHEMSLALSGIIGAVHDEAGKP
jgi:hypothetical protein